MAKQSIQPMANSKKELFVFGVEESPSIPQPNTMNELFCPYIFFIYILFLFVFLELDQQIMNLFS